MTYEQAKQVVAAKSSKPLTDTQWQLLFEAEKVLLANGNTSNQSTYDQD